MSAQNLWLWPYLEKVLCRCNAEMRSLKITQGCPKSKDKCPYKGKTERNVRHTKTKVMWRKRQNWNDAATKPRTAQSHEERNPSRKDSSTEPSKQAQPCWHRDFRFDLQKSEGMHFCWFKSFRSWHLVMAATGNWHKDHSNALIEFLHYRWGK